MVAEITSLGSKIESVVTNFLSLDPYLSRLDETPGLQGYMLVDREAGFSDLFCVGLRLIKR